MKIKKSELEQIIKEEALKVKKIKLLKEEKNRITRQLNELYEDDCVTESESILDLIPDPEDKKAVQQDMQNTQQPLEESIGSSILNKISDILFGKVRAQNPEAFEAMAKDIQSKYAGKSYADIYKSLKGNVQKAVNEEGEEVVSKDKLKEKTVRAINSFSRVLGLSAGSLATLSFAGSTVATLITGSGYGLPSMLASYSLGLIITAVISGIIYAVSSRKK